MMTEQKTQTSEAGRFGAVQTIAAHTMSTLCMLCVLVFFSNATYSGQHHVFIHYQHYHNDNPQLLLVYVQLPQVRTHARTYSSM